MIIVDDRRITGDLLGEIARLEDLLAAVERLAAGRFPTAEELSAAPVIDGWFQATRPAPCLAGQFHGHPMCRGPLSMTSDVWIMAAPLGWARTYSRLYRLGEPLRRGPAGEEWA